MVIDKTKFLFLVGAIAVATTTGCKVSGSDDGSGGGTDTASSTGGSTATSEGTGGSGDGGAAGVGGAGGSTSSSESVGVGTGGSGGGAACDDEVGVADACTSTCEGLDNCSSEAFLKPARYADAVPCLDALDPLTCSYLEAKECLLDSLAAACADPTADALAIELAATCVQSEAEIHAVIDGLNQAGRDVVADDANQFCDGSTYFINESASVLLFGPPL